MEFEHIKCVISVNIDDFDPSIIWQNHVKSKCVFGRTRKLFWGELFFILSFYTSKGTPNEFCFFDLWLSPGANMTWLCFLKVKKIEKFRKISKKCPFWAIFGPFLAQKRSFSIFLRRFVIGIKFLKQRYRTWLYVYLKSKNQSFSRL